jgi:hypothetical protein
LEAIYSAIDALCDVVLGTTTAPKAVTEIEAPSVRFHDIGEDLRNKYCDYSVALLSYIRQLVDEELAMRHGLEREDEADYFVNGTQE